MDLARGPSRPALGWPVRAPAHGAVRLRAFTDADVPLALALSLDPYVSCTGTLPAGAAPEQALAWVRRHRTRHLTGTGGRSRSRTR